MNWCLVGKLSPNDPVQTVPISTQPFTIGRRESVSLRVPCTSVSKFHAELVEKEGDLYVSDLGSTNGTYVNGRPVQTAVRLVDGDLLQIAGIAFRVCHENLTTNFATESVDAVSDALLLTQLERLMSENGVIPKYQPIVRMHDRSVMAYEVLGRSRLFGLSSPKVMFDVAARLDLEPELSHMMRMEGVKQSFPAGAPHLFLNTHPAELDPKRICESLRQMRALAPTQKLTVELHEAAVTNIEQVRELRKCLDELNIELAYDDFGAGRGRLREIAEVRLEYLKFDMDMIRGIDSAPATRQHLVRSLVEMTKSLGIRSLAEGVETEGEHRACLQLGFELGQGFLYGRPGELPVGG